MRKYKITIEYDGTNYIGWQKQIDQKKKKSIQSVIETALYNLLQKKTQITASGRTDAGVHAIAQVCHFTITNKILSEFQIMMGLNFYLKKENISILNCELVDINFHSRFDAKERCYKYHIYNRRNKPVLNTRSWHIPTKLNIEKMRNASKYLLGTHDFTSFRDSECQAKSPIKTIKMINIIEEYGLICITICAKSFLHHMVRNIVGTLVLAGKEKIQEKQIKEILDAKNRKLSGPNAPSKGLFLSRIFY